MGLKVWLPLINSLENQGCSAITATGTNLTTSTAGKIGSCYSFNGSSSYIRMASSCFTNASEEFSYTCWFKPAGTARGCLFSCRIPNGTDLNSGITIFVSGSDIFFDIGGERRTSAYTFTANTWYHIAFTYKKNEAKKVYVNGVQIDTVGTTGTMRTVATNMFIGASQNTDTSVNANYVNGLLNDVRIYDNRLSAAEVHEISQGLVLHYKLDHFAQPNLLTGNINLIAQWTADGVTRTQDGNSIKVVNNNSGNHRIYNVVSNVWTTSGQKFTVSFDAKATANGHIIQASRSLVDLAPETTLTTEWKHYTVQLTNTASVTDGTLSIQSKTSSGTFWIRNVKLEKGTVESRFVLPGENDTSIKDSSGYGHNGSILNAPTISSDTSRYSNSLNLNGTTDGILIENLLLSNIINTEVTYSFWIKPNGENSARSIYFGSYSSTSWSIEKTTGNVLRSYWNGSPDEACSGATITDGVWQHVCITKKGTSDIKVYINGIQKWSSTATHNNLTFPTTFRIGRDTRSSDGTPYKGLMSDFRIYATALSADDVKQLYQVGAKVDNRGGLHTFEAVENLPNIIFKADSARGAKVFQDGLSRYTQTNCQVTLTDNGYRIYRPPNLSTKSNGGADNMWGGLKLVNQTSDTIAAYDASRDNCWNLQQSHTYLCAFHVKGQSTNTTSFGWTNNMGWGGGGVSPSPTILINDGIPANFQGEKDCIFIFTIGDTISKACTSAYSSYAAGTTYLSYRHLTFGWGYTNTGTLGTDVYLTNFRLYDITSYKSQIKKQGIANFGDFVEEKNNFKIRKNTEAEANNLIEL